MATNKDFIVQSGLQIKGTATATNTYSGALVVAGGAGIAGDLWVGGSIFMDGKGLDNLNASTGTFVNVYVTGTNVSISTTTGALVVTGGLGVGGSLYATALYDTNARVITTATIGSFGVSTLTAGTDTVVSASTGPVTVWNNSTLQTITNRGATTNNAISITNANGSTGSTTGALVVTGGVGVGQNLNVARQLTVAENYGFNTLSNTIAYFGANTTTFAQVNLQNIGGGTSSSVDFIATSNNGNDDTNFVDLGINNSSFTDAAFTIAGANDAYLYTVGGNVAIGAASASKDILFFQGGTLAANEVGRWANASGLVIKKGTVATTTNTGALIVQGGTGIWGNLFVGGNTNLQGTTATTLTLTGTLTGVAANFSGAVTSTNGTASTTTASGAVILSNSGGLGVGGQVTAAKVVTVDATAATAAGAGSLQVAGGAYIANNLVVNGTGSSTSTTATNALQVTGGAYIGNNLTVNGPALFKDTVTFAGTATYVYSTNTFYTDNLIELHTPPGGVGTQWTIDDGKDIGLRFHYYSGTTDTNAALVLGNDNKLLEWYGSGAEDNTGTFVNAAFGGFKTGYIQLMTGTNATSAVTGALQVAGGIGVGQDIWVSGKGTFNSTVDTTGANTGGLITLGGLGISKAVYVGTTATVAGAGAAASAVAGNALQVTTGGLGVASSGYFGGAVRVASNTAATNTTSGALQVVGGIGVGGALYVGGIIDTLDTTDAGLTTPGASGSLQALGGAGIAKNLAVGGTISRTGAVSQASWQGATGVALNLASATYTDTTSAGTVAGPNAATWLGQPTLAASSAVTYVDAATLYIANAPTNGTNVTLTNPYALLVANGIVRIKSTTASSNTTTGALVVDGGVGVGGSVYATALYDNGSRVITAATIGTAGVSSITAGTGTVVSSTTGAVTIWSSDTLQLVTDRGATTNQALSITNSTISANTNSSQALLVSGGIGAQAVYASQLFDSGNRVVTNVAATGGTGLTVTTTTNGTSVSFALANTGVTSLAAGTAIAVSGSTGAITVANMGVTSLTGTANQITVSASTGSVTLSLPSGITTSVVTATTTLFATGSAIATGASTGALQVTGGASVNANIYVGTTATVAGTLFRNGAISAVGWLANGIGIVASTSTFTDTSLTGAQGLVAVNALGRPTIAASNTPTYSDAATLYIADAPAAGSGATISSPWSLYVASGNVKINTGTASNATNAGALVVTGGVGIGGNLNVGGSATFASTGVLVGNSLISSYTSGSISTTSTQNLDTFTTSTYRTARYTVQVVDGTKVHISEMTVFHDNTVVYKNEYGISYNTTELGAFDATLVGSTVTLTFTPNYIPAAMTIKATRTAITAQRSSNEGKGALCAFFLLYKSQDDRLS